MPRRKTAAQKTSRIHDPEVRAILERDDTPGDDLRSTPVEGLALHGKATAEFRFITAADATAFLARLGPNRTLSAPVWREYAAKKRQGLWRDYHPDPLILTPAGKVLNAQHRLKAMAVTGIGCIMLVVQYHDAAEVEGLELELDRGRRRTTRDILTLGMRTPVTNNQAACARSLYYGIQAALAHIPDTVFIDFYRRYQTVIVQACRLLSPHRKSLTLAPIAAALARALLTVDAARIERFAEVLLTGKSSAHEEHTIITLRNYLLMSAPGHSGGTASVAIYARTTGALKAYLDHRVLNTLQPVKAEVFPLTRPPTGAVAEDLSTGGARDAARAGGGH